ncbi:MAG: transposase [Pseudomonadota bacterium]
MPLVIANPSDETCSLPEAIEALADLGFDPRDKGNCQAAARWLRRLTNNRKFLGCVLVDQLAGRLNGGGVHSVDSGYGPQAIILSPLRGSMFLRANIWPAESDLCFQTSGAKNFVYGVPHDHNFSFLTSGYCGPGYRSDYYEYDYEDVVGYPGEAAGLRFVERSALHEGKLMLYRAHVDVHSQLPPEALSVSLNVMHVDPAQGWFDQYGFDLERGQVTRVLSPNATEAFLRVAVASGTDEAHDYAEWVGQTHPSERLRLASFEARAALAGQNGCDTIWREGELSGSRMVAAVAKEKRGALDAIR